MCEANPHTSYFIEYFKLEKTFDTVRMYKGKPFNTDYHKVFGVASLEIG